MSNCENNSILTHAEMMTISSYLFANISGHGLEPLFYECDATGLFHDLWVMLKYFARES